MEEAEKEDGIIAARKHEMEGKEIFRFPMSFECNCSQMTIPISIQKYPLN